MIYNDFYDWLLNEKKLSQRAAKDVISRYKRIIKLLNIDEIDTFTIEKLNTNAEFVETSMFIKSQLRRACSLWNEFGEKYATTSYSR